MQHRIRGTRLRALLLSTLALAGVSTAATSAAQAASGGPVVLMGIDAEDGGPGGHGPLANYVQVTTTLLGSASNGGDGILVFGGSGGSTTYVQRFFTAIGTAVGEPVTFVNGSAVGSVSLDGRALVAVASDFNNTGSGGLRPTENTLLTSRKDDIAAHVNGGGGLLGFASDWNGQSSSYGYLGDLGTFTVNTGLSFSDITPTADGLATGITNALDICCWHDEYVTYPSFLQVLATNPATGRAAAIGGRNVVISDIQLTPPAQARLIGEQAQLVARLSANGAPIAGTPVRFEVLTGPNAGRVTSVTSAADGTAELTYTSAAAGTDTVEATFVDGDGTTQRSSSALVEWQRPANEPPVVGAGTGYEGEEGRPVALDGTATDPDGDALDVHWAWAPLTADAGASCAFADAHEVDTAVTCTDDGEYRVTLTADDGTNEVQESFTVAILDNVAPVVGPLTLTGAQQVACLGGNEVRLEGAFTDAGANDTHQGEIEWGDGSAASPFGASPFGLSHVFGAGTYTAVATVTDDDGAEGSRTTAAGAIALLYATGEGFLPPISNKAPESVFRLGSTIPVKLDVVDCDGADVTGIAPQVGLRKLDGSPDGEVNEVVSSSSADDGRTMRRLDDRYQYNLSTKRSQFCTSASPMCSGADLTPGTYELRVTHPSIAPVTTKVHLRSS